MIDMSKLQNVVPMAGKTVARCPACAADGRDTTGNHLIVFEDGRFGCVCHPGDSNHRREIWRLVGVREGPPSKPRPVVIKSS
jgi:hypothetical protein